MVNIEQIFQERKIEYVSFQMTTILGDLKCVEIPVNIWNEICDGPGVDGSSLGWLKTEQSDMIAAPDLNTLAIYPWDPKTANIICDMVDVNRNPWPSCPRGILRKIMKQAQEMGIIYNTRPELEWYFVQVKKNHQTWEVTYTDNGKYMDVLPFDINYKLRKKIVSDMLSLNMPVKTIHHECGPGQQEIEFQPGNALYMGDYVQRAKVIGKACATTENMITTYMPKPFPEKFGNQAGSGLHIHQYLTDLEGKNIFAGKGREVTDTLRYFVGGVLNHVDEFTALCNPTTNSYKRLVPGHEAPVYKSWGVGNRTALLRIPGYEKQARIEYRATDCATNIYLASAVILAAGLDGIKNKIAPNTPTTKNIEKLTPQEAKELGISQLPSSLKEALDHLEKSKFMADVVGKEFIEIYLRVKRQEWNDFIEAQQRGPESEMQWEYQKYLERS